MFKKPIKYNNLIAFFSSLAIVVVMFLVSRYLTPFVLHTNDDVFIQSIVSGEASGTPDAHMIHSGFLLGIILSNLYKLLPTLPWYGLYLSGSIMLSVFCICYKIQKSTKTIFYKIVNGLLFFLIAGIVVFPQLVQIQYTVVAAFVMSAAIFWMITSDKTDNISSMIKSNIPTLLLLLLALNIRWKVVFMCLPFAGVMWLYNFMKDITKKKNFFFLIPIIGTFLLFFVIEVLAYSSPDWNEFKKYNVNREHVYDYYGYPDFEKNAEQYEALSINRLEYELASKEYCLLPNLKINAYSMESLANISQQQYKENENIADKLLTMGKDFVIRCLSYFDRPINLLVLVTYGCALLFIILYQSKQLAFQVGLLVISRIVAWGVILWKGRYPFRITQSLFLVEGIILAAILISFFSKENKEKKTLIVHSIMLAYGLFAIVFMKHYAPFVIQNAAHTLRVSASYEQLQEYCLMYPETLFYLDMNSVSSSGEEVFKIQEKPRNMAVMGSWLPRSPLYHEKEEDFPMAQFIFRKDQSISFERLEQLIVQQGFGNRLFIVDEIKVKNGSEFLVLEIER